MRDILGRLFSKKPEKKQVDLDEEIKRLEKEFKINKLKQELLDLQHEEVKIIDRKFKIYMEIRRLNNL